MARFALLILPSANRVYADNAPRLTLAELAVVNDRALDGRLSGFAETRIGGVPYVTFEAAELSSYDVRQLSNVSSCFALFRCEGELLAPVTLDRLDRFGSDLLTIQKYSGKTNEQFTKLLLLVTALSVDDPAAVVSRRLSVLDPLCGRGTTLNQAMMFGWHAAGIDIDGKDVESYATFLRTWLKNNRIKHHADFGTIKRNRKVVARRLDVEFGEDKDSFKAGDTIRVSAVAADTRQAGDFFSAESYDVIAADTAYGVQHGNRGEALRRGPAELLAEAIPVWSRLLRPGGAMGLSWNTRVASRDELVAILAAAGLDPAPYQGFEHRVDQAIVRDLIVAQRRVR